MSITSTRSRRVGFTLVELLVVIGIIALLISILLPVLNKAKQRANAVKCQSNLKTLMMGFIMFSNDHNGYLPGSENDYAQDLEWKRCWLKGPKGMPAPGGTPPITNAPTEGTVYKYLKNSQVYRCPSNDSGGTVGAGGGTNERFDYCSFKSFAGAKITKIKNMSRFRGSGANPATTDRLFNTTPVICQEDPAYLNASNMDSGHSNFDPLDHVHNGGSYYASVDGSVSFVVEPIVAHGTACASLWESIPPSERKADGSLNWTSIGDSGGSWGWWNGK